MTEHFAGKDNGYRLWAILMFQLWYRVYIEEKGRLETDGVRLGDL
jgi:hypothetical protein